MAIARKFSGLMIEGNHKAAKKSREIIPNLNPGVECLSMFVNKDNAHRILEEAVHINPDLLSIDIDGNDYYIAKNIIEAGLRPKIVVVEYNSIFGPSKSVSIPYVENFNYYLAHESHLYYGVSVSGWKSFFEKKGYKFVTVDSRGTNAFFVRPDEFDDKFISNLKGLKFQENFYQMAKFKVKWEDRYSMIKHMNLVEIE